MKILLDENKNFYKANLHCHSTNSDGRATPEDIKREYMARGYSVISYTDHERILNMSHLNDDGFLTITGGELSIFDTEHQPFANDVKGAISVIHFNLYAKDPENDVTPFSDAAHDTKCPEAIRDIVKYDGNYERIHTPEWVNYMTRRAHELGFLISYNHASWSLETASEYMQYDGFDFVEIFNTGCVKSGHVNDEHVFEDMLMAGKRVYCTAADDNHNIFGFDTPRSDSFGGYVMINAEKLEYGEIVGALERGDFYSSNGGPDILSISVDGEVVTVKTAPAARIFMRTNARRGGVKFAEGEPLTEVRFKLLPEYKFFRIRVEGEDGKCSYSQAYFTEDFKESGTAED